MHSPKAPKPDPAIAAAQASELARATAGQVKQTQDGLNADDASIRRRFGTMASSMGGGSVSQFTGVTPASFSSAVAASVAGGGGLFAPSVGGGSGLNRLIQLQ